MQISSSYAEVDYYDRMNKEDRQERAAEKAAEQVADMLDSFDGKDASFALAFTADEKTALHERLCDALAGLTTLRSDGQRPMIRAVIEAWQDVANEYARKETAA